MDKLLSVCMIVKNEEAVIDRCLSSINDYADEIIIVDTGSTDLTKQIAAAYTDLIYDFEWINDFSAARNAGIRRATGQWILVVDADEYYHPAEAAKLRTFLETETPNPGLVYAVSIVSYLGTSIEKSSTMSTGEVARLFPNHQNIFYTRPIHEQLYATDGTPLHFQLAPGSLYHTGYLKDAIESKDKLNRNAGIFSDLKKNKGFSAYDYYTVGNEKAMQRDFQSAIYYYERSLKKSERNSSVSWYPRCIISLVQAYLELKRVYDAWHLIETKLIQWNQYPEYYALKGSIYYYIGLFDASREEYQLAYRSAEKLAETTEVFWLDSPDYASTFPLRVLSDIAVYENDVEKTVYYLTKLLMQNPYDYRAITQLIDTLAQTQPAESISQLLNEIGNADDRKFQLYLFKVTLALGHIDLSKYYWAMLEDVESELDIIDRLNLALLQRDEAMFGNLVASLAKDQTITHDILVSCTLGSLMWGSNYYERITISEDHALSASYNSFRCLLEGAPVDSQPDIFTLLTKCYLYHNYDLYDRFVNAYSSSEITNMLANFFYNKKNYDLALNYYSLLLRNNDLSVTSLENLSLYHLTRHYIEDGLEFILAALEKRPDLPHLITLYLRFCTNPQAKQTFIKKYGDHLSYYRKIPLLASLLK
ncbi:Glycosyl transferase family 2 [Paenibacillus sp. UNC496MF]|uniref:tetratricopeptide repeat-containing glycosyltransferase family 2 protein n=1 Tax=Paenibacillus sp. UNC496MF TaxID=1502753 RepID=UPI0008EBC935|nr:glycosyltransferase family 2 protein [Paenibacillus sp. UNC496MF]SFJ26950.1 Glycosyl transferase family 2 [Paenibacillus sp. UNC496MF]